MSVQLCDRFPALSPFSVREKRWHDVLLIYGRLLRYVQAEKPEAAGQIEHKGTLWTPTASDDWW